MVGHLSKHRANIDNLLDNGVALAEHPDIIETIEKEVATMRNNLNAVNGAIQIVDKMIAQDENFDPKTGQMNVPEKEGGLAPEKIDRENVRARQAELEIEEKNKQLLNEGDK